MRGALLPLSQYVFMAWCLVKHRYNLTFTFTFTCAFLFTMFRTAVGQRSPSAVSVRVWLLLVSEKIMTTLTQMQCLQVI